MTPACVIAVPPNVTVLMVRVVSTSVPTVNPTTSRRLVPLQVCVQDSVVTFEPACPVTLAPHVAPHVVSTATCAHAGTHNTSNRISLRMSPAPLVGAVDLNVYVFRCRARGEVERDNVVCCNAR